MVDILISGGPVIIPLGILSMVAFAIIIDRLWTLRRSNYLQDARIETLSGLLAGNKFRGATDYCRRYPGPFTELVTALIESAIRLAVLTRSVCFHWPTCLAHSN